MIGWWLLPVTVTLLSLLGLCVHVMAFLEQRRRYPNFRYYNDPSDLRVDFNLVVLTALSWVAWVVICLLP